MKVLPAWRRDAGDNVAEDILRRDANHDGKDARREQERFEIQPVSEAENDDDGGEEDEQRRDLVQKPGQLDAMALFEIQVPDVTIHQSDDETRAENAGDGGELAAIGKVNMEQFGGPVNGKADGKEVVRPVKLDAVFAFEPAPQPQHQAVNDGQANQQGQDFPAGIRIFHVEEVHEGETVAKRRGDDNSTERRVAFCERVRFPWQNRIAATWWIF